MRTSSLALLLIAGAACALGVGASVVMTWASGRSALANMVFAGLLLIAVLLGALAIALVMTQSVYPR